ncbi:hypothetical protein GF351_06355 [Candidatus Woesearchaeota archaeon]|nr:hypothetical protein [Candidatus Woesearchaeota archaeon]
MSETEYESGESGEQAEEEQEEPESQEEDKGDTGEEDEQGQAANESNSDGLAYQTDPEILDEPYPDDLARQEYNRWKEIIDSYKNPDLEEHWSREGAGTSLASKLEEDSQEHNPPPKPDDDIDLAEGYDNDLKLEEVISNGVLLYHS